jgi:hypothetical protein
VEVSGGLLKGYGYSSNDMLLGHSLDLSAGAQWDTISQFGLEVGRSWEVEYVPEARSYLPIKDRGSDMQPYMDHLGMSIGLDGFPTGVDVSVDGRLSQTYYVFTTQMYPWKWERRSQ